jgi:hypothetical protein
MGGRMYFVRVWEVMLKWVKVFVVVDGANEGDGEHAKTLLVLPRIKF